MVPCRFIVKKARMRLKKTIKKQNKDKEKEPLTREGFFKILDKVIKPKAEKKPPKKEKKGTSE